MWWYVCVYKFKISIQSLSVFFWCKICMILNRVHLGPSWRLDLLFFSLRGIEINLRHKDWQHLPLLTVRAVTLEDWTPPCPLRAAALRTGLFQRSFFLRAAVALITGLLHVPLLTCSHLEDWTLPRPSTYVQSSSGLDSSTSFYLRAVVLRTGLFHVLLLTCSRPEDWTLPNVLLLTCSRPLGHRRTRWAGRNRPVRLRRYSDTPCPPSSHKSRSPEVRDRERGGHV